MAQDFSPVGIAIRTVVMAPKQKAMAGIGSVVKHGKNWRARIQVHKRKANGPQRATRAAAQVDLDGARQMTTRAEIPEFFLSLRSSVTQSAAVVAIKRRREIAAKKASSECKPQPRPKEHDLYAVIVEQGIQNIPDSPWVS